MKKLNQIQKQQINGGAGIPAGIIYGIHGAIQLAWVVMDAINLASDYMPKTQKAVDTNNDWTTPKEPQIVNIENDLINGRNIIYS